MGKRLMTLSDLYNYYSAQNKTQRFSCDDEGDTIVVIVDGKLNFSKEDKLDGLYATRVQLNFVGDNLNGSRIRMNAQKAALSSSHYRPLLACIHEVDGEPQFYGHNMHQDENGEIVYDEQPVGVIIEEAHIEHDDEYDMDYAVAKGYIWKEYSKAAYILERDSRCDVSVELSIRSLSYDAKDKILNLDDFYYSGCTILGYDEDGNKVNPAMPGSNITLADFSAKNNSTVDSDKLLQAFDRIEKLISKFEKENRRKEETTQMENFEDEIKKNIPDDDVVEETPNEENEPTVQNLDETPTTPNDETENQEGTPDANESTETPDAISETEGGETEGFELDDENKDSEDEENSEDEFACGNKKKKCSVELDGEIKEFSVSLSDKQMALETLVNETYGETDCDYYFCDVYEEDGFVVMHSWSGKHFRQSFKCKKNKYSLVGDRVNVYAQYLTEDEIAKLDAMKSNYSSISEKLEKYESEPKKIEILESAKYGYVAETEEFAELKNNHFDMSVEDVTAKANEILLSYAEQCKLQFSENKETKKNVGAMMLPTVNKKESRYGNLFAK